MTGKVELRGVTPSKTGRTSKPTRRTTRVWPVRLRHFLWLPFALAPVLGLIILGVPHLLFSGTYRPTEAGGRHYLACDYVGWHARRIVPDDGVCPLIRFFTVNGGTD